MRSLWVQKVVGSNPPLCRKKKDFARLLKRFRKAVADCVDSGMDLKSWLKTWGPDHCQHSSQQPCEIFSPPTHPLGLRSFNNAARGAHV